MNGVKTKKFLDGTKIKDLRGMKFGKLTVIEFDWDRYEKDKNKRSKGEIKGYMKHWLCECSCGKTTIVDGCNLVAGKTTSCTKCFTFYDYLLSINKQHLFSSKNTINPHDISCNSANKVIMKCSDCLCEKSISCNDYVHYGIMCKCKGGISYPNRIMYAFLNYVGVEFEPEKIFDWENSKRYDFYIANMNCIIEVHGMQHYRQQTRGRSFEYEQYNDKLKRELALNNGIRHYIELDCRKSELELIKNSVMNSDLPKLFSLKEEDVDWLKVDELSQKNKVKEVCEFWNNNKDMTIVEICNLFSLSRPTIRQYLKNGTIHGWCDYKAGANKGILGTKLSTRSKSVEVFRDGNIVGVFKSAKYLAENSDELFGVKFLIGNIYMVCTNKRASHKGYTFRYVD